MEIFTLHDTKSGVYREPTYAPNQHVLIRDIVDQMKIAKERERNPEVQKNMIFANSEDYSIYKIGSFDAATGQIESQPPEHIVKLIDLKVMTQGSNLGLEN